MSGRLGELLVRENLISLQQLQKAQEEQRKTGGRLGSAARQARAPSPSTSSPTSSPSSTASRRSTSRTSRSTPEVIKLIPKEVAREAPGHPGEPRRLVADRRDGDPSNIFAIDDLKFLTGYNVELVVASRGGDRRGDRALLRRSRPHATTRCIGDFDDDDVEVVERRATTSTSSTSRRRAEDAPVVKLVNVDPLDAIKKGASRHPRRALREGLPRPLPHRRRALRGDEAAAEAARTRSPRASRSWPSSTSPSAGCRRTAASS